MNHENNPPEVERSLGARADTSFVAGGGEMGALIRSVDWQKTPLGPLSDWPQSLRTSLSICLSSRFPIVIFWGPALCLLYNDAYLPMIAGKHPRSVGQSGLEAWAEIRNVIEPMLRQVMATGEATWSEDLMLPIARRDRPEESYFTFTYSPIRDESGGVGGVFCAVVETTEKVIEERRLRLLNALADVTRARTPGEACALAAAQIARSPGDVPFALLYLHEPSGVARLAGTANVEPGTPRSPLAIRHGDRSTWPFDETGVEDARRFVEIEEGLAGACTAVILPIEPSAGGRPLGFIVAGLGPLLPRSGSYDRFHNLLSASVSQGVSNAAASEEERKRTEALAELDRAKTMFFGNVSHEFRTPLTLMLAPLQDMLAKAGDTGADRAAVELLHRNALRLLKLVNTLLEFSRIEAGRMEAVYEPVDLAVLTADLASSFRAAMERAGLALVVDCPPLAEPIYVDRDMWEKIVLNLLSNAFKFTFAGSVTVRVRMNGVACLEVADTGTGIAPAELPRLFERFHRIEGARARTHEGSGIGLALVHELVQLQGGSIAVTSNVDDGTTFTVAIPRGTSHLPRERIGAARALCSTSAGAAYVEEALRWLPAADGLGSTPAPEPRRREAARILVADDNRDMREYIARVLRQHWNVEVVSDGMEALEAVRRDPPDLVVADVMMPRLDGLALVRELKGDARTVTTPIVLLSARAGDEAAAEGLRAGATDYLVKPFSASALVVRIEAQLAAARLQEALRRDAEAERDRLRVMFEESPSAICMLRGPELRIELANPIVFAAWGKTGSVVGLPFLEALPELRGQGFAEALQGVLDTGVSYRDREAHVRLDFGNEGSTLDAYFDFVCAPFRAPDGAIDGVFVHGYDVTDRVIARQHLEQLREDAEATNRLKDEFLAMLGHELRNPLAPILSAVQSMKLRSEGPSLEREVIERQARHLARLVNDLLDVSRVMRGKIDLQLRPLRLSGAVSRAVEMSGPMIEQAHHVLVVDVPEDLWVRGDEVRLVQVVANLVTNAAKYTPAHGRIRVDARRDGEQIVLRVKDNGVGVEPELLPRMFDLFVQGARAADRREGGLGLGLTLVRTLTELHGGTVAASSGGQGMGAELAVRLPAIDPPAAGGYAAATMPPPPLRRRKILVVDDNEDASSMLAALLCDAGHDVAVALDALSAVELAREFVPDVCVLDLGLPEIDGVELGRRLKVLDPDILLIALTGYGKDADRLRTAEAGFAQHLIKPVSVEDLLAGIDVAT